MKKWFTVFRNRSDLPEMTFPLALVMLLLVPGSAVLSVKMAAVGSYGWIVAVASLILSVTGYTLLILLWRRLAVFAATPLSALALFLSHASWFAIAVLTLGSLFLAYVLASAILSRETRYRRMMQLSFSVVLVLLLSGAAYLGLSGLSVRECVTEANDQLTQTFVASYNNAAQSQTVTQTLGSASALSSVPSEEALRASVRSVILTFPAYLMMAGILFAWLCDALTRFALKELSAIDDFIPWTHRITLPKYYAAAHIVLTVLLLLTSYTANPLVYACLQNLFFTMCLPCLYIGCVKLRRGVMIRLYFLHGKRAISLFVLIFAALLMGISNFILIFSFTGAIFTLTFHRKMQSRIYDSVR